MEKEISTEDLPIRQFPRNSRDSIAGIDDIQEEWLGEQHGKTGVGPSLEYPNYRNDEISAE